MLDRKMREISYNMSRKKEKKHSSSRSINSAYINYTKLPPGAKPVKQIPQTAYPAGSATTSARKRQKQSENQLIVALVLAVLSCILLFTSCFSSGEDGIEDIDAIETTTIVNEVVTGFLDLQEEEVSDIIDYAMSVHKPIDLGLAIWHVESLQGASTSEIKSLIKLGVESEKYKEYQEVYAQFVYDIKYFLVGDNRDYVYEEHDWGDNSVIILDPKNTANTTEVISMTDGTVVKLGWEEQTGYTIYIQSDGGAIFCYGYLETLPTSITEGSYITAGSQLGMMSNRNGITEGQVGNINVGVYLETFVMYNEEWTSIQILPFVKRVEDRKADVRWIT
ncbi:MAG: hypothetical protein ATN35_01095 [Epulopiscium sp. Nele67-Bin004]|nr:MAG: hypothetical protein ATN35_01095 [Epulopiscium sp. Nele67-Bin004]